MSFAKQDVCIKRHQAAETVTGTTAGKRAVVR
jgi:hypothetical protein